MSVSREDFLKTLYHIYYDDNGSATSSELAGRLKISGAAVTDMAKRLSAEGVIHYKKYKPISLTDTGHREALSIIRKHRLWETFLYRALDIPYEALHGEAENLEHVTSDLLLEKIDHYLGHPGFDPHGDPIPGSDGMLPSTRDMTALTDCYPGKYIITRIQHRNNDIGAMLKKQNLRVSIPVEVIEQVPVLKSTVVVIEEVRLVLNDLVASQVYVKKV